jgi:hypothetical protein
MKARMAGRAVEGITETVVDPGVAIDDRGDSSTYTRMALEVIRSFGPTRGLGRPIPVPIPGKGEDHRVAAYITTALKYGVDLIAAPDIEMAADLVVLYDRSAW